MTSAKETLRNSKTMPKNCCKYFTVSLVPTAALILAILFAGGIIILPVLYEELTTRVKVSVRVPFQYGLWTVPFQDLKIGRRFSLV